MRAHKNWNGSEESMKSEWEIGNHVPEVSKCEKVLTLTCDNRRSVHVSSRGKREECALNFRDLVFKRN
jgi:hypothetical protein